MVHINISFILFNTGAIELKDAQIQKLKINPKHLNNLHSLIMQLHEFLNIIKIILYFPVHCYESKISQFRKYCSFNYNF